MDKGVFRPRPWRRRLSGLLVLCWMLALFAPAAHPAPNSAPNSILVLGDSLSAEYGLARGAGWVGLLEKKLAASHPAATVFNASISGDTTSGGRARLPGLLERQRPTIVILELGANDGLRGLQLAATEANLRAMIGAARGAGAQVLLVGMQVPPNYGPDYTRGFSTLFQRVAKETGIPLVPFLLDGIADQPRYFQEDRMHPTAEAQPHLLDNVWPHLKPLLKK